MVPAETASLTFLAMTMAICLPTSGLANECCLPYNRPGYPDKPEQEFAG